MKRFEHISWYGWILMVVFGFMWLATSALMVYSLTQSHYNQQVSSYTIYYDKIPKLSWITTGILGLAGLLLFIFKKRWGWALLFSTSVTQWLSAALPVILYHVSIQPSNVVEIILFSTLPIYLVSPKIRTHFAINWTTFSFCALIIILLTLPHLYIYEIVMFLSKI